jgi:hypothetical protein
MRLFRQPTRANWQAVFDRLASELKNYSTKRRI